MNTVELFFDESAKSVFLRLARHAANITRQDIMKHLTSAGFSRFFIHPQAIDSALSRQTASDPPTANLPPDNMSPNAMSPNESTTDFRDPVMIAEQRDAVVNVILDATHMTATLSIIGPYGGQSVTAEQCQRALAVANVMQGIEQSAIESLVGQAQALDHGAMFEALVARGIVAVNGDDSRFEILVPTLKDRVLSPHEESDGSVDFHDLGDFPVVKAGQALLRRTLPTLGSAGVTVQGETCEATPGKCLPFKVGPGTLIATDNENLLLAEYDGMPMQQADGRMSVERVVRLPEVSVKTGNITFGGTVLVDKDVSTGFTVYAESDITIGGEMDSARLVAGNDITIPHGIHGYQMVKDAQLPAQVCAGHHLHLGFAQFAELHGNQGVVVANFLMHCHVTSFDWVKLGGDKPGKSKLIGGETRAVSFIKADTIGTPDGTHTYINLRGNFAQLRQQRESLTKRLAELERKLEQVNVILSTLTTKSRFPRHVELMHHATTTREHLLDGIAKTRERLQADAQAHQQGCEAVHLIVTRKAHAGTEIVIGDHRVLLTEDWGPGMVQYGPSGLMLQPGKLA